MSRFSDSRVHSRRRRRGVMLIMLAMMGVGLVVTLYMLQDVPEKLRQVSFDPRACVRMLRVSRVYAIRPNPSDSSEIWFATAEGVRVFDTLDGSWIRYGMDHGLGSETITDFSFDGDEVWAGTWNGLARFERATQTFTNYGKTQGLGGTRVLCVQHMPGHGAYCYVDGKGIQVLAPGDSLLRRVPLASLNPDQRVTMLRRSNDTLCIGAEKGRLLFYVPADSSLSEAVFERERSAKTFVWDMLQHRGRFYLATSDAGLWSAASRTDTLRFLAGFPAKGAYAFAMDDDGLWCGSPFGLWRYHDAIDAWIQFFHPEQSGPVDFQVFALARTGTTLWYGSMDRGAGYLNTLSPEWKRLRAGISNPNVCAIAADDSLLWIGFGYQGGYLDQLWAAELQYARNVGRYDRMRDPHIQTLYMADGRLYYGSYRGFGYRDMKPGGAQRFFLGDSSMPYGDVAQIALFDSTRLMLAALFGALIYTPANDSFEVLEGMGPRRVSCLHRLGDTLWIGTLADGVFAYDLRSRTESYVGLAGRDRVSGIVAMPGEPRHLLVAMRSGACHVLDVSDASLRKLDIPPSLFEKGQGAYSREIVCVSAIDDRAWLGMRESGVAVLSAGRRWQRLDYYDGLPSNEVRAVAESPGYVWIGCYGGLCRFDKDYLQQQYFADNSAERNEP